MALGHPASAATSRNGTAAIPPLPLEQRAARRAVCDVLSFAKNYFRNGCCEAFSLTRKPGCPFRARLFALVAKYGDWSTATLQATLAEQRTALLRHSATAPSETRAYHAHTPQHSRHEALPLLLRLFSLTNVSPKVLPPVRNAPLHPSLATVVFQPFNCTMTIPLWAD